MLQHGIPAHIAESARCLFRECMRRADFVGNQHGNKVVLKSLVREQFRRNMHETDPQKIEEQKQAAARALFNHMYYEASRMAAEQGEEVLIKESLLGLPKPALGMTLQDEDNRSSGQALQSSVGSLSSDADSTAAALSNMRCGYELKQVRRCLLWFLEACVMLLFFLGLAVLVEFVIVHPRLPECEVVSLTLTQFSASHFNLSYSNNSRKETPHHGEREAGSSELARSTTMCT